VKYPITLTPGRAPRNVSAQLVAQPNMREAEITVFDSDGAPIVDAEVRLDTQTARTDVDGLAVFALVPGRYALRITADNYVTAESIETIV
jgi:uncharacterized membrane protein